MQLVAEINGHELTCRIVEACMGIERPEGKTAQEALQSLRGQGFDEAVDGWYAAAAAAAEYLRECAENAGVVQ